MMIFNKQLNLFTFTTKSVKQFQNKRFFFIGINPNNKAFHVLKKFKFVLYYHNDDL